MTNIILQEHETKKINQSKITLKNIINTEKCSISIKTGKTITLKTVRRFTSILLDDNTAVHILNLDAYKYITLQSYSPLQSVTVNHQVKEKIRKYGLNTIRNTISLAVPYPGLDFNYRSDDWLLKIQNNILQDIQLIKCTDCDDTKKITVYDDCISCDGPECIRCQGSGLFKRLTNCQKCINYLTKPKHISYNKNSYKHKRKNNK